MSCWLCACHYCRPRTPPRFPFQILELSSAPFHSTSAGGVAAGCKIHCNREVNARIYGHTVGPVQLLGGDVKPPNEFDALYKLLTALASEKEDHSAAMLGHIDDSGSTLIYRMPIWLYDD